MKPACPVCDGDLIEVQNLRLGAKRLECCDCGRWFGKRDAVVPPDLAVPPLGGPWPGTGQVDPHPPLHVLERR